MKHLKPWDNAQVNKVAICIANLGVSQLSYLTLKNAPKLENTDTIIFFEDVERPCVRPLNSIMAISELWCHVCDWAIATDLSTATKLSTIPGPKRKFFYVWDLEFIQNHQGQPLKNFTELVKIYNDPAYELVARSEDHANLIEKVMGRKVKFLMKDMNLKLELR